MILTVLLLCLCFSMKRFAVSHYVSAAHIRDLEDRGLQGDTILVEGIRTGSARCLARLRDTVAMVC